MKPLLIAIAIIAVLVGLVVFLRKKKKEKYTNGATLGPLIRSPNSETHDVLEYSLGGFGGSPTSGCQK
jgi:LPXTG-motif cell wall-anchored protein